MAGNMKPSIGRIVIYTLSEDDAEKINRRRITGHDLHKALDTGKWHPGAQAHFGNPVVCGDEFPMIIVGVDPGGDFVNGQVMLDGNDTYWATSVHFGTGQRQWKWPQLV